MRRYVPRHARTHRRRPPTMRFRSTLFWDVDPKTIDPEKHARYVIARILDFGNDREVRWMWRYYTKAKIRDVVQRSRVLSEFSKPLWEALTRT